MGAEMPPTARERCHSTMHLRWPATARPPARRPPAAARSAAPTTPLLQLPPRQLACGSMQRRPRADRRPRPRPSRPGCLCARHPERRGQAPSSTVSEACCHPWEARRSRTAAPWQPNKLAPMKPLRGPRASAAMRYILSVRERCESVPRKPCSGPSRATMGCFIMAAHPHARFNLQHWHSALAGLTVPILTVRAAPPRCMASSLDAKLVLLGEHGSGELRAPAAHPRVAALGCWRLLQGGDCWRAPT